MHLLRCLIFLIIIGLVKSHGRVIILAILGLVGLWMTHLLAQDYQSITNPKAFLTTIGKLIIKRSTPEYFKKNIEESNWNMVVRNDPLNCLKSFLCQIAAKNMKRNRDEEIILNYVRTSAESKDSGEIKRSIEIGESSSSTNVCANVYYQCPYTAKTMSNLLKIFSE